MWQFSRFLFWLGEQSWFPFSTLRLWYWTLGFKQAFSNVVSNVIYIVGGKTQYANDLACTIWAWGNDCEA